MTQRVRNHPECGFFVKNPNPFRVVRKRKNTDVDQWTCSTKRYEQRENGHQQNQKGWPSVNQKDVKVILVGGLVAMFYFPINLGCLSSSQLTNSYFSEGWLKTTNQSYYLLHPQRIGQQVGPHTHPNHRLLGGQAAAEAALGSDQAVTRPWGNGYLVVGSSIVSVSIWTNPRNGW